MEKLEEMQEELPVLTEEKTAELKPKYTEYDGLKLMDEKVHMGGTGKKYWM